MNATRNAAPDRSVASSAPDFSTPLPTPLALDEVVLMSYAVLHNRLELRLKSPRLQIDVAELLTHLVKISAGKYVVRCTLESLRLSLCILSVTSTKTATLLRCRTLKDPTMAAELLPMVGRACLSLTIGDGPRPRGTCGYDKTGAITIGRQAARPTPFSGPDVRLSQIGEVRSLLPTNVALIRGHLF